MFMDRCMKKKNCFYSGIKTDQSAEMFLNLSKLIFLQLFKFKSMQMNEIAANLSLSKNFDVFRHRIAYFCCPFFPPLVLPTPPSSYDCTLHVPPNPTLHSAALRTDHG